MCRRTWNWNCQSWSLLVNLSKFSRLWLRLCLLLVLLFWLWRVFKILYWIWSLFFFFFSWKRDDDLSKTFTWLDKGKKDIQETIFLAVLVDWWGMWRRQIFWLIRPLLITLMKALFYLSAPASCDNVTLSQNAQHPGAGTLMFDQDELLMTRTENITEQLDQVQANRKSYETWVLKTEVSIYQ